jgi:hypothetical protein
MHPVSSEEAGVLGVSLVRNTGYAVFPCKEDKTPATRNGVHNASNDPARVANLWEVSPGPLIGIATGAASGVDVLDIDSGRHPEADAWWKAATSGEIRPSILPTRVYRTRSGGLHAYYRHTPGGGEYRLEARARRRYKRLRRLCDLLVRRRLPL